MPEAQLPALETAVNAFQGQNRSDEKADETTATQMINTAVKSEAF